MDDSPLGRSYAADFLTFLKSVIELPGRSILEIGAGRGYFLELLGQAGATALGMEPGKANAPYWSQKSVSAINDFFPGPLSSEKFDVIAGFALLEHIEGLDQFLQSVTKHLAPGGLAVFAVPECDLYVADGDPGMLLHEHWSYFTASALRNVFEHAGFGVRSLKRSSYGGLIYVAATPSSSSGTVSVAEQNGRLAEQFGERCARLRAGAVRRVAALARAGRSLGIYVPGRVLVWIDPSSQVRFFDDDAEIHGQYYPPFAAAIESRDDLLRKPVDELWIMSKSFGKKIASELAVHESLRNTNILMVEDLLREFGSVV
ncbi:class I SAM-dependent methyltransferase [Bradyrhizobium sp.]|uniref:class I SAM-dependent methyltransferase n=1 Tax=Bradyrhizobium sp. TaxID=376 RepID=UPI003C738CEB